MSTSGSSSFRYSFLFLPPSERRAITAIYAFCRQIDDIVDDTPTMTQDDVRHKQERLAWWRTEIERCYRGETPHQLMAPMADVIRRYTIPQQYLMTLIDGCERDLYRNRYATWAELKEYCYAVASIVGLMSIEVFGYRHEETKQYAINLGYALQLTNIIRDVKQDKDRGIIYLPLEDLQRFRVTEDDIINEVYDERFRALMAFQTQRARDYYHRARTALRPEERLTMVAAEIMDAIYYRLLEKIELNQYDVFSQRIHVNGVHKIITALRMWLGAKLFVRRFRKQGV